MAKTGRALRGSGVTVRRAKGWYVRRSEVIDGKRHRWFDGPYESEQSAQKSAPLLESYRQTADTGEWLTNWAQERAAQLRTRDRHASAVLVERHVRLHLAPNLTGIRIGDLRPSHVSALVNTLQTTGCIHRAGAALGRDSTEPIRHPGTGKQAKPLSAKSVRNILSTLSTAMKTAVNDDLLRSNPVRDAELIAEARDDGDEDALVVFTDAQADALAAWCLANVENETWALPVLIGLDCGLRRGEILAIKSTLLDPAKNRLKVNTGITEEEGVLVDRRLKTKRSRRTVVIPDRTIEAIKRYRAAHDGVTPISGLLFVGHNGEFVNPDTFTQGVRRTLRPRLAHLLGDIQWSPHTLRHTYATRLLSKNVPAQTVSGLLGHESTAFTQARYSHWIDSDPPLLTSQVTEALGA